MKRVFDIVMASLGLLILSPLFIILYGWIKLTSPGPAFYYAPRVGKNGKPITAFKFRSMIVDADKLGGAVTTKGDARVTPVGRFLRQYKLDELPQLLNVLNGTMSLVGPRPESPRYVALYTSQQRGVLAVRPGITSPASLRFRLEEDMLDVDDWESYYVNHLMPAKLEMDLAYVQKASLLTDIKIIIQTLRAIIRPKQMITSFTA